MNHNFDPYLAAYLDDDEFELYYNEKHLEPMTFEERIDFSFRLQNALGSLCDEDLSEKGVRESDRLERVNSLLQTKPLPKIVMSDEAADLEFKNKLLRAFRSLGEELLEQEKQRIAQEQEERLATVDDQLLGSLLGDEMFFSPSTEGSSFPSEDDEDFNSFL